MIKTIGLAVRFTPLCVLFMLASCSTTDYAKIEGAVPTAKPSAEEIALLSLQSADTSGATTQTAELDLKPVDQAGGAMGEMAYAVPTPKPATLAALEVASVEPAAVPAGVAMTPTTASPVLAPSNAMLETEPKTRSLDPFAVATKNGGLNMLIAKYAALYEVPERLVHRVVRRESNYNPGALHSGNWGLMQIRYNTARGMGYTGTANGLLDAETNLKYAVKYLRGAWIVADRNEDSADWLYRTGYYYQAKAKGLLVEAGLK